MEAGQVQAGAGRPLARLLDADPDLAQGLSADTQDEATEDLLVSIRLLERGTFDGQLGAHDAKGHFGLLVLEGLLLRELYLAGSASGELLGQGDLLRPWDVDGEADMPVPARARWVALTDVRLAVLGPDFVRRAARYPEVLSELTSRTVHRAKGLMLRQAITNLKHVETRLLLLFWHLADRWGRVGPEEISLTLPLTHEMLGKLVGATRPSVTTALGQLDRRGLLRREGDVWRLRRDVGAELEALSTH